MAKTDIIYKGYRIRKSGKDFWKILDPSRWSQRAISVEAAKVMIDASLEHRPYTPAEHAIVYPKR